MAITSHCIRVLKTLSPDADNYVDQVINLGVTQAAAIRQQDLRGTPTLLRCLGDTFVKTLAYKGGVTTMNYIHIFEGLCGRHGPLRSDQGIAHYDVLPKHSKFIAAMFYLSRAEFSVIDQGVQTVIKKQVSEIALEAGKNWDGLNAELQMIDAQRPEARTLHDIALILEVLQNQFTTEQDVVFIQKSGGVKRLKEIGAGINAICLSMLKRIPVTSMGHVGLPLVHQFLKDANNELLASGAISQRVANERLTVMMTAVLNVRRKQKKKTVDPCYHEMMVDLMPNLTKEKAPVLIPRLTNYVTVPEIANHLKDPASLIQDDLDGFKMALKKQADASLQYDLVMALGLDGLFEPSELQKLKGAKLESALGL